MKHYIQISLKIYINIYKYKHYIQISLKIHINIYKYKHYIQISLKICISIYININIIYKYPSRYI